MTQIDTSTEAVTERADFLDHCIRTTPPKPHRDGELMRALAAERDTATRQAEDTARVCAKQAEEILRLRGQLAEARNAALEEAGKAAAPGRIVSDDDYSVGWVDGRRSAVKAIEALKSSPAPMRCAECDCEKGGEDCNWFGTSAPQPSVQEAAKVKPLDLATVLKHAFLSGFVAAREIPGHEECDGNRRWVDYEPYEPGPYTRILRALAQKEGE